MARAKQTILAWTKGMGGPAFEDWHYKQDHMTGEWQEHLLEGSYARLPNPQIRTISIALAFKNCFLMRKKLVSMSLLNGF